MHLSDILAVVSSDHGNFWYKHVLSLYMGPTQKHRTVESHTEKWKLLLVPLKATERQLNLNLKTPIPLEGTIS